ncbi:MAG: tryptophan--tRNA ligase [Deltaproteobacteria bacterium]|nr:tryptophan--tRNA ligase [Deltaproteobacteria bacterium]
MRILSGIQPSGSLHIGNYFGMMKPMISYLERAELFVFIVNLHALTTVNDSEELKKNTLKAAVDFLALGLEPEKCVFWVQSDVLEVTELTWILSGVTSMGLLERCHSYKDKIAKGIVPNHGLKQHVEVARDIALRFNHIFGETFVIPEPEINEDLAVVPGIDGQKMSKSYNNAIDIFTDRETLNKTIMRVVTDSTPVNEPKNPDTCNLFALYRLFAGPDKIDDLRARYLAPGLKYAEVKKELAQLIWDFFGEHREKHAELMKKQDIIRDILRDGANKARAIARETMDLVRDRVGINY